MASSVGEEDCRGHEADDIKLSADRCSGIRIKNGGIPRRFYHLPQRLKAEVVLDRIRFILKHYYKKQLEDYNRFEFQIYTARMLMLECQTMGRLMDRDSECFSDKDYNKSSKEFKALAKKHVALYSKKADYQRRHNSLKKRAKEEPDTLFLIVADEAHWGVSGKEEDAKTAEELKVSHKRYVASWNCQEFSNVLLLEVSATPYPLLTTTSQIPVKKLLLQLSRGGDEVVGEESGVKAYRDDTTGEVVPEAAVSTLRRLHVVEWNENWQEQFREGAIVSIQVPLDKDKIGWLGTYEKVVHVNTDEPHEFCITSNIENKTVSICTVDSEYIVGYKNDSTELFLYEKAGDLRKVNKDFVLETGYGEDVFTLKSCGHDAKYVKHSADGTVKLVNRRPAETFKLLPAPSREYCFLFYASRRREESKYAEQYLSLNFFYNSMRNATKKEQLLRLDERFTAFMDDLRTQSGIEKDDVLCAEYAFFTLLLREIRCLKLSQRLIQSGLAYLFAYSDEALCGYPSRRQQLLDSFCRELRNFEKSEQNPITADVFETVCEFYRQHAMESLLKIKIDREANIDKFIEELFPCMVLLTEADWKEFHKNFKSLDKDLDKFKVQLLRNFKNDFIPEFENYKEKYLNGNETLNILNDLIQRNEMSANAELNGHMKVIRTSTVENGNTMYVTLCLARRVASAPTPDNPLYFEVIRDYGSFRINMSSEKHCEPNMKRMLRRVWKTLQTEECQDCDLRTSKHCTCKDLKLEGDGVDDVSLVCRECNHVHKQLHEYTDLERLPCILVLVNKGRLGSTYPRSMNVMDLRLGEAGNPQYTACVQEFGRLCRYVPKTTGKALTEPYALIGNELALKLRSTLASSAVFQAYFSNTGNIDINVKKVNGELHSCKGYLANNKNIEQKNQILLKAEPQIGKTGVYLRVISMLRKIIEGDDVEVDEPGGESGEHDEEEENSEDGEEDAEDISQNELDVADKWLFPYWKDLDKSASLPTTVTKSKYARLVGEYRYGETEPPTLTAAKRIKSRTVKTAHKKSVSHSVPEAFTEMHTCSGCCKEASAELEWIKGEEAHEKFGQEVKISIPANRRYKDLFLKVGECTPYDAFTQRRGVIEYSEYSESAELQLQETGLDDTQLDLNTWIFTPTYGRCTKANVNLYHTMHSGHRARYYIHVLVVRAEDFPAYCKHWASSHAIVELPAYMPRCEYSVSAGAVGYARVFIQRLAEHFRLDKIFMMDDNIPYVKEAQLTDDRTRMKRENRSLVMRKVLLFDVLKGMEVVLDEDFEHCPPESTYEAYRYEHCYPALRTYTGPVSKYAVVGIGKERLGSTNVKKPFKRTHVFSLVLVNIRALQEKNVKYKPWPVFEDLTLNNACDEHSLWVVKMNRFAMKKRNLQSWLPEVVCWTNITSLCKRNKRIKEVDKSDEEKVLLSWLRCHFPPVRLEAWPRFAVPGQAEVDETLQNLVDPELSKMYNQLKNFKGGKCHVVCVRLKESPEAKGSLLQYFKTVENISGFQRHAICLPYRFAYGEGYNTVKEIQSHLVGKVFEDGFKVQVVTSHEVKQFKIHYIIVSVQGKVKTGAGFGSDGMSGNIMPHYPSTARPKTKPNRRRKPARRNTPKIPIENAINNSPMLPESDPGPSMSWQHGGERKRAGAEDTLPSPEESKRTRNENSPTSSNEVLENTPKKLPIRREKSKPPGDKIQTHITQYMSPTKCSRPVHSGPGGVPVIPEGVSSLVVDDTVAGPSTSGVRNGPLENEPLEPDNIRAQVTQNISPMKSPDHSQLAAGLADDVSTDSEDDAARQPSAPSVRHTPQEAEPMESLPGQNGTNRKRKSSEVDNSGSESDIWPNESKFVRQNSRSVSPAASSSSTSTVYSMPSDKNNLTGRELGAEASNSVTTVYPVTGSCGSDEYESLEKEVLIKLLRERDEQLRERDQQLSHLTRMRKYVEEAVKSAQESEGCAVTSQNDSISTFTTDASQHTSGANSPTQCANISSLPLPTTDATRSTLFSSSCPSESNTACAEECSPTAAAPASAPATQASAGDVIYPIRTLNSATKSWCIRARVTQKSAILYGNNTPMFSMNLMDASGEIQAMVRGIHVQKFYQMAQQNEVYYIKNGCVSEQTANGYSALSCDYKINFKYNTEMWRCQGDSSDVPNFVYNFVPISELKKCKHNSFVDVIGIVLKSGDVTRLPGKTMVMRSVTLEDEQEATVNAALWGAHAENFDSELVNPVLAIRGTRINQTYYELSVLSTCNVDVNPAIAEARKLRDWFDSVKRTPVSTTKPGFSTISPMAASGGSGDTAMTQVPRQRAAVGALSYSQPAAGRSVGTLHSPHHTRPKNETTSEQSTLDLSQVEVVNTRFVSSTLLPGQHKAGDKQPT